MAVFDFRGQQERSRRLSWVLVALFVFLVAAIGLGVGAIAALALNMAGSDVPETVAFDTTLFVNVSALAMLGIVVTALFKIWQLGGDGARVAQSLGAEEVTEDTQNPYKRRYLNVVEEMAIAAGLPRPRAFVIKHERGINAFAAGSAPERAAVGVTHGALTKLNREELAGVVAHEMAHIANHDTRLNMLLMGMVFGLVALYTVGRIFLRQSFFMRSGRDNKGAPAIMAIAAALLLLGLLGMFAGRILQSAVSRKREYLADATGVQFTRDPKGLAGALKKIGATVDGSRVENGHAEEARHMFFAGATGSFAGLLGTHPPLHARIRALDPGFDPKTDPIYNQGERAIMRGAREGFGGPWG